MRSLYYPASRPIARGKDFLLFLLSTAANRWDVVASLDLLVCWCPIIARVQTEMLRPLLGWLGTGNDDAIQGRVQQFHIVAVGSVDDHGQGNASPISQETALGAFLPRSVGLAPVADFPRGAFVIAPSTACHSHWIPSNSSYTCSPACHNLRKKPFCSHCLSAIMYGRTGSQCSWQRIPLDTSS